MKKKKYLFNIFIIVLILTVFLQPTGIVNGLKVFAKKESTSYNYINKKITLHNKYNNNIYTVQYPLFKNTNINNIIKNNISSFIDDNSNINSMYITSSVFNNKILSIKINMSGNLHLFLYDIDKATLLNPSDILNYNYPNLLFQKVQSYYLNNYSIKLIKTYKYYKYLAPTIHNYNNMYITSDYIEFTTYDYILKKSISLKIDIDKVLPYMKSIYLKNGILTTEMITQPTTQVTTQTTTQKPKIAIRTLDKNRPMLALTFDDGPNGKTTHQILSTLKKYNSAATFFLVGSRINNYKDTVAEILKNGNQIGNHSYNHTNFSKISNDAIHKEINLVNKNLNDLVNYTANIVRVPYGGNTKNIKENVYYPIIMWNVDTVDWKFRDKNHIINTVINKVKDGDIILMHDLYKSTADACEYIIPKLIKDGFQLVTIAELFKYKNIELKAGNIYYNAR